MMWVAPATSQTVFWMSLGSLFIGILYKIRSIVMSDQTFHYFRSSTRGANTIKIVTSIDGIMHPILLFLIVEWTGSFELIWAVILGVIPISLCTLLHPKMRMLLAPNEEKDKMSIEPFQQSLMGQIIRLFLFPFSRNAKAYDLVLLHRLIKWRTQAALRRSQVKPKPSYQQITG